MLGDQRELPQTHCQLMGWIFAKKSKGEPSSTGVPTNALVAIDMVLGK